MFGDNGLSKVNDSLAFEERAENIQEVNQTTPNLPKILDSIVSNPEITAWLDKMNAILYKLPDYQIKRLQKIQKNTASLCKAYL